MRNLEVTLTGLWLPVLEVELIEHFGFCKSLNVHL